MIDITGDYIHLFETQSEYETERTTHYAEPWVSYTKATSAVTYNKSKREIPLTFEITGDGNIVWKAQDTAYNRTIEYKKNDGEWTSITSATGSSAPTISVVAGDKVQFRGDNATYYFDYYFDSFRGTTCSFNVEGNIMSLIDSTDFATATTFASSYTFFRLFHSCTGLTDASNLVLPATTLAEGCYSGMFSRCSSLTEAPALPATTLANSCYESMFDGCTSLTTAPELPATTLADYCYLTMFSNCTNLNYIKCLATNISASNCLNSWVYGVASAGTFVKADNMSSWGTGNNGIPTNWTVQDA